MTKATQTSVKLTPSQEEAFKVFAKSGNFEGVNSRTADALTKKLGAAKYIKKAGKNGVALSAAGIQWAKTFGKNAKTVSNRV